MYLEMPAWHLQSPGNPTTAVGKGWPGREREGSEETQHQLLLCCTIKDCEGPQILTHSKAFKKQTAVLL